MVAREQLAECGCEANAEFGLVRRIPVKVDPRPAERRQVGRIPKGIYLAVLVAYLQSVAEGNVFEDHAILMLRQIHVTLYQTGLTAVALELVVLQPRQLYEPAVFQDPFELPGTI